MLRLSKEEKERKTKVGAFLNLNHAWAHAHVDDLPNQLGPRLENLVAFDCLESNGRGVKTVETVEDNRQELLRVNAVDANLGLLPVLYHVVQQSDYLLNLLDSFNPLAPLRDTAFKRFRMHRHRDLVYP